jgi:hypothetical protein
MASSDASQLAGALERRLACGNAAERRWADAAALPLPSDRLTAGTTTGDAAQLPANITRALPPMPPPERMHQIVAAEEAARGGDAAQLPAGSADATARLMPEHVLAIQQEEAARGPPRLLHELAADAFDTISNGPTWATFNLDAWFPWMQYVAAHTQSAAIIGPGITHAHAVFLSGTNDANRGGAPRLDFCFTRTDGTVCLVHPGKRPKDDARLTFA